MSQTDTVVAALKARFRSGDRQGAIRDCAAACLAHPGNGALPQLLGLMHSLAGDPAAAAAAYLRAAQISPQDADLAYNLGVCLQQLGQTQAALQEFTRALQLRPGFFEALANLGLCAYQLGQYAAALDYLGQARTIAPRAPHVADNLGLVYGALGDHAAALAQHELALQLAPEHAPAWTHRGLALDRLGRHVEALACHDQAVQLNPQDPQAWLHRGECHADLHHHPEALSDYDRALALDPGVAAAWSNRGVVLHEMGRHAEALAAQDRALALAPGYAQAWSHRGVILHDLQRHAEALAAYDQALRLEPRNAEAWSNRGVTCHALRRDAEALECCARAIAADPNHADAHLNAAQYRLGAFDLALGWDEYEWRWNTPAFRARRLASTKPEWTGSAGRLLLYGEQGIGDQILYASLWREIAARAGQVTVRTDPRLIPLLARSFPELRFESDQAQLDETGFDAQLPVGSAGRFVRRAVADFGNRHYPYLRADAPRAAVLRAKLAGAGELICGLSWQSRNERVGALKSLRLRDLLPVLSLPMISAVDLQYGDTRAERNALQEETGIAVAKREEVDTYADLDGLAALIEACDLVVTTSNTTAHLAGALGKPTWLLLPYSTGKFWYWHTLDGASPWYPSIRIFQQAAAPDWRTPIEAVAQALTQEYKN